MYFKTAVYILVIQMLDVMLWDSVVLITPDELDGTVHH
jgi:hypothetical protein